MLWRWVFVGSNFVGILVGVMIQGYYMCDVQELCFIIYDGVEFFYCYWLVSCLVLDGMCQVVLLFYCGYEYFGWIVYLVDEFDLLEYDFFVWDVCGYGFLLGVCGDSLSFVISVCDVQIFVDYIQVVYGIVEEWMVVVVQSVGVVLVFIWVYDYVLKVCVLVLVLLVFQVKFYVLFVCSGLKLMCLWCGNFFVNSYVKVCFFSYDLQWIVFYDSDLLIVKVILVNVLFGFYEVVEWVVVDVQVIQIFI